MQSPCQHHRSAGAELLHRIGLGSAAALSASWALGGEAEARPEYGEDDGASGEDVGGAGGVRGGTGRTDAHPDDPRDQPDRAAGAGDRVASRSGGPTSRSALRQRAYAPIRKLVVHHSASTNGPSDPADVVRSIYRYHTGTRGFSDIGYNYLIDHRGTIYEGRYARRFGDEPLSAEDRKGWGVVGAHAKGTNAGTCGICLIGDFTGRLPTEAALASLPRAARMEGEPPPHRRPRRRRLREPVRGRTTASRTSQATATSARPSARARRWRSSCRRSGSRCAAEAGRWDPLIADLPRLLRYEWSPYGQGPLTDPYGKAGATKAAPVAPSAAPCEHASKGATPATGSGSTAVTGIRALTSTGLVFTAGTATEHGQPGASDGAVVGMSTPGRGDGYVTLSASGVVRAFGGLPVLGDVSDKGGAADIVSTASGNGYWILMANGGIYPFGDARYHGSPLKRGLSVGGARIARRPQGDGYWVLGGDGVVYAFGSAPTLASPPAGGVKAIALASSSTGAGYWVLHEDGAVTGFGDAVAAGGPLTSGRKWAKPAVAIAAIGATGYLVSGKDGGLLGFGGAPFIGSFAGSGATVVAVVDRRRMTGHAVPLTKRDVEALLRDYDSDPVGAFTRRAARRARPHATLGGTSCSHCRDGLPSGAERSLVGDQQALDELAAQLNEERRLLEL